ncbi:MAG: hypothetical protein K5906_03835 [Bacilli bacterium]|nr:hypothetical protein [Bacilli bacterium]
MINFVIGVYMALSSIFTFALTLKVNCVNRVLVISPKSIPEKSIPLTIQGQEVTLYYEQEEFKKEYDAYLNREIKKYVDEYTVEYYFYNPENGGVCDVNDCRGVEITVGAKIMFVDYKRTIYYEISEGKYHG